MKTMSLITLAMPGVGAIRCPRLVTGPFFRAGMVLALLGMLLQVVLQCQAASGSPSPILLHSFGNAELSGSVPAARVVEGSDGRVYGTARVGGGLGVGSGVGL